MTTHDDVQALLVSTFEEDADPKAMQVSAASMREKLNGGIIAIGELMEAAGARELDDGENVDAATVLRLGALIKTIGTLSLSLAAVEADAGFQAKKKRPRAKQ